MLKKILIACLVIGCFSLLETQAKAICAIYSEKDEPANIDTLTGKVALVYTDRGASSNCDTLLEDASGTRRQTVDSFTKEFNQVMMFNTAEFKLTTDAAVKNIVLKNVIRFLNPSYSLVIGNWTNLVTTDAGVQVDYTQVIPGSNNRTLKDALNQQGEKGFVNIDATGLATPFKCETNTKPVFLRNLVIHTKNITETQLFDGTTFPCLKNAGAVFVCDKQNMDVNKLNRSKADSAQDPAWCANPVVSTETNCTDGIDNDNNGQKDCADTACRTANPTMCGNTEISCTDAIDNDGDGLLNCLDTADCSTNPACLGTTEICTDGRDNDGDNRIDCIDSDCRNAPNCQDLFDNDGDGYCANKIACLDIKILPGDCNDSKRDPLSPTINPAANDIPGDKIDQNCDGAAGASLLTVTPLVTTVQAGSDRLFTVNLRNVGGFKDKNDAVLSLTGLHASMSAEIPNGGKFSGDSNSTLGASTIAAVKTVLATPANTTPYRISFSSKSTYIHHYTGLGTLRKAVLADNLVGKVAQLSVVTSSTPVDVDGDGFNGGAGGKDCDDSNAAIFPGAPEQCTDGLDNDCDGLIDRVAGKVDPDCRVDNDNDGFGNTVDCNDNDPRQGVKENCTDTFDNDCDNLIDRLDPDCQSGGGNNDQDGDGYADPVDCNPTNPLQGGREICNDNIDNDCDVMVDSADFDCRRDADNDGYRSDVDCNDNDPRQGVKEICNDGADNNCDGLIDAADPECKKPLTDRDQDDYPEKVDCNDNNKDINPGKTEICGNSIDDDCNKQTDEGCNLSSGTDDDKDGFCEGPICTDKSKPGDCNDANKNINPSIAEDIASGLCGDGIDNNCDGLSDDLAPTCAVTPVPPTGGGRLEGGAGCSLSPQAEGPNSSLLILMMTVSLLYLHKRHNFNK